MALKFTNSPRRQRWALFKARITYPFLSFAAIESPDESRSSSFRTFRSPWHWTRRWWKKWYSRTSGSNLVSVWRSRWSREPSNRPWRSRRSVQRCTLGHRNHRCGRTDERLWFDDLESPNPSMSSRRTRSPRRTDWRWHCTERNRWPHHESVDRASFVNVTRSVRFELSQRYDLTKRRNHLLCRSCRCQSEGHSSFEHCSKMTTNLLKVSVRRGMCHWLDNTTVFYIVLLSWNSVHQSVSCRSCSRPFPSAVCSPSCHHRTNCNHLDSGR